jgi:ABC-type multidrug transport system ATPase subunit
MRPDDALLRVEGLAKRYEGRVALHHVSLCLRPGVVALLGHNGSGKSTLLRLLATLTSPTAGTMTFGGQPYAGDLRPLRRVLGYLPQDLDLPPGMTPRRLLCYLGQLRDLRLTRAELDARVDALLAGLGLATLADRPLSQLSGGQARMVGLAQAVMGEPGLLLLDELTRGLDVDERARAFRLLRTPGVQRLTMFSTHIADECAQADALVVLARGRLAFCGTADQLMAQTGAPTLEAAYLRVR